MSKQVYISADYDKYGDRYVVDELVKWGEDDKHKVDFIDMSNPSSGSVANSDDCRICDLKAEFNSQINASSAVIFVVGDMTKYRTAGSGCERNNTDWWNVSNINSYSYLRHEFEQAKKKDKTIIILYNSTRYETSWLPSYMDGYEDNAHPFWKYVNGKKVGDYEYIKEALGF